MDVEVDWKTSVVVGGCFGAEWGGALTVVLDEIQVINLSLFDSWISFSPLSKNKEIQVRSSSTCSLCRRLIARMLTVFVFSLKS